MPWKECCPVPCREEFVGLARAEQAQMFQSVRRCATPCDLTGALFDAAI